MKRSLRVLQPDYYPAFHCIASDCEDSCCEAMGVVIDKPTYEKYVLCDDPILRPIMDREVVINSGAASDSLYAFVAPVKGRCPFLDPMRLCRIQSTLGEASLSRTCSLFPRSLTTVDAVVERSLSLSCPEAARLALLNPDPMRFTELDADFDERFRDFPAMSSGWSTSGKPYQHAAAIRRFAVGLLQNRTYPLWERLVILGMFCEQLDSLIGQDGGDDAPTLVQSYFEHIEHRLFAPVLEGVIVSPAFQVDFVRKCAEEVLTDSGTGIRFRECYAEFNSGIEFEPGRSSDELAAAYVSAGETYLLPFLEENGHMLEHFVVNHVFRSLFPLGPQSGLMLQTNSVYDEYVLLAIRYAVVHGLLVGIAGQRQGRLSPADAVKLIQSFSKAFEHNVPLLKRLRQSMADSKMDSPSVLAALVRT